MKRCARGWKCNLLEGKKESGLKIDNVQYKVSSDIFCAIKFSDCLNISEQRKRKIIFRTLNQPRITIFNLNNMNKFRRIMTLPCNKGDRRLFFQCGRVAAYTKPSCTGGEHNTTGKLWLMTFLLSCLLNTGVTLSFYMIRQHNVTLSFSSVHINDL